jgi:hypothetical protein
MAIEGILDREGYTEPTILLPGRALDMAQAILSLGGRGDLSAGMVPPLLVHLFAVVEPDAEDRDHHRGALAFLAHQGGFTAMPMTMQAGEEMKVPEAPAWVRDERFCALIDEMHASLDADVGVTGDIDGVAMIIYCTDDQRRSDGFAQRAIGFQPAVRATVAAISGRDPGYIPISLRPYGDPLKSMGIHAATPAPTADPIDKVIMPTSELRFGDRVRLWQIEPNDPTPMRPGQDEEFIVEVRTTASSSYTTGEVLGLRSLTDAGGSYHRDFTGYRWEVVARAAPSGTLSEAARIMQQNAIEAGF